MPRSARIDVGDHIYHVINRANGRLQIFNTKEDYRIFEKLVIDAEELLDMRILAYVFMPNHWHFLLHTKRDGDLGTFMHKITNTHTRKVHAYTNTEGNGSLYQGRFKSFLVDTDAYVWTVLKYIERNPVRAQLVDDPALWRWGSAYVREHNPRVEHIMLTEPPCGMPPQYRTWIRENDSPVDLEHIRNAVVRGMPYGDETWVGQMTKKHGIESTLRERGRPKK